MKYKVGRIGIRFLLLLGIEIEFVGPASSPHFYNNSAFPQTKANEVMERIFTPSEKNELAELIEKLKTENSALITTANSLVSEKNEEYTKVARELCSSGSSKQQEEGLSTEITCKVFNRIPPYALNLLALIEIKKEHFPVSYNFFKQMIDGLNKVVVDEEKEEFRQERIKETFSQTIRELENLVNEIKKKSNDSESGQTSPNQTERENEIPSNQSENQEKPKSSENNENPNHETNEPTSTNPSSSLLSLKEQTIQIITNALNQNPKLNNTDLSPQYHDWQNQLNNFTEENKINFLREGLLVDIKNQRKKKLKKQTTGEVSEIINSNLQKAQNPHATIEEKKEALADNEKYEGQSAYEDTNSKEQTKNLKKEVAQDNPAEYRNKIISDLDTKLKKNNLTKKDLDNETQSLIQALKEQKISDLSQLVETEIKITQKIGQQGATKKITTFKKQVEAVLESNNKTEIAKLRKQLIEFIESNNVYCQAKKQEAEALLKVLESGSINSSQSSEPWPFSTQIGIGMGAVSVVLFSTLLIYKKKKKHLTKN